MATLHNRSPEGIVCVLRFRTVKEESVLGPLEAVWCLVLVLQVDVIVKQVLSELTYRLEVLDKKLRLNFRTAPYFIMRADECMWSFVLPPKKNN